VLASIDEAAERLGNTRAVARSSYVAPAVVDAHLDGSLHRVHRGTRSGKRLDRGERTVMRVLQARLGAAEPA
jgi:DNA topoisomerase I